MENRNIRRFRVLHGPHDVGGNAYYLAKGEREYGFDSRNLVYSKQWFGYPADFDLKIKQDANPMRYLRWWLKMAQIALTYDVLHFNFGGSFLTYYPHRWVFADLQLWRSLGMPTYVTFQGCDSRISSYVLSNLDIQLCENCRSRDLCGNGYNWFKQEIILQAQRYFDKIFVLNPDLLHNIPGGQFLPYANCDLDEWRPPGDYDWHHSGPVRVLHAPTWRELKGTDAIIAAVESLKAEGENVELVLIEKIPHDRVRTLYESADLLVDQLIAGWYGGLAVELMALGKPVVAYLREGDLCFIPPAMKADLPVVSATAETLKPVLRGLIRNRDRLKEIGRKSRSFVETWHHPRVVAKITTDAYGYALAKRPPIRGKINRLRTIKTVAGPMTRIFITIFRSTWLPLVLMRRLLRRGAT